MATVTSKVAFPALSLLGECLSLSNTYSIFFFFFFQLSRNVLLQHYEAVLLLSYLLANADGQSLFPSAGGSSIISWLFNIGKLLPIGLAVSARSRMLHSEQSE